MQDINELIHRLLRYSLSKGLIQHRDLIYHQNNLLKILGLDGLDEPFSFDITKAEPIEAVEDILSDLTDWAMETSLLHDPTTEEKDLFDTKLIGALIPPPSQVEHEFYQRYQESAVTATDFYYDFSKATNYIREQRIAKDEKWRIPSSYGDIHMSINRSKPEKDPRDIARAKTQGSLGYPQCLLCVENENYAGRPGHPARGNHRLISMDLNGEQWFLQYSPYVYYNEHCIILKSTHDPMKLSSETFQRMMAFLQLFPHYFIGSNADLPIVGGSILAHDHFQGGRYTFPMEVAKEEHTRKLKYHSVTASILNWPVSVLRLKGQDPENVAKLAHTIYERWQTYSDPSVNIIAYTDGTPHNTLTPIGRFRNGSYELDLALRNNRTTTDRPFGLFHPRESLHHIKKENIGLIEVMGLAILPARLKTEMEELGKLMVAGNLTAIQSSSTLSKHVDFARDVLQQHSCTPANISSLLHEAMGHTFVKVLEDTGVFKRDIAGIDAFERCLEVLLEDL